MPERLPERHSLDAPWVQSELELEREVRQLFLQLHLERVRWLLPDRPEEQLELPLPAQKEPLEDLSPRLKEDQSEPEAELPLELLA